MAVVGETFVVVHAVTAGLEKELSAGVKAAAVKAEAAAKIKPKIDTAAIEGEGKKLEGVFARVKTRIEQTLPGGKALHDTMDKLKSKLHSVAEEGGPVSSKLAQIAEKASGAAPVLGALALGLAATVGVLAIGTEAFLSFAESVHKFSLATGASAEDSSRFVVALRLLGLEPDRVAQGLFRLTRQVSAGTSKLGDFNIEIAKTSSGNTDVVGTFLNIADAIKNSADGSKRAEIAYAAFGRQGLALLPILARGREGLRTLFAEADKNHEILHEADLQHAIELRVKLNDLKESVKGLKVEAGKNGIDLVGGATHLLTRAAQDANTYIGLLRLQLQHYGLVSKDTANDVKVLSAALANNVLLASDLQKSILGVLDAKQAETAASNAETSAANAVADATYNLNKLRKQGAVDLKAVKSAQDALASSSDQLASAQDRLATAEKKLADLQAGATPRDLEEANLRVSQSNVALARAQEALSAQTRKHRVNALDLADAQNAVEAATLQQADAADNLTKIQAKGSDTDADVIAAKKDVESASHDVTKAFDDQANAATALREAQQGDPEFAHRLADANNALRTAVDGVATAKYNHLKAAATLVDALENEKGSFTTDKDAVVLLRQELEQLAQTYGVDVAPIVDRLNGLVGSAGSSAYAGVTAKGTAPVSASGESSTHPYHGLGGRASGGPTKGGVEYRVNEYGDEFFKSDSSGTIYPTGSPEARRASSGSGGINQTFHITDSQSPQTTAALVNIYTARSLRTAAR